MLPSYASMSEFPEDPGNTEDYLESRPLGEIPQVRHTYTYFDHSYGIINEKQLMIGECTCGAKFHLEP